MYSPGVSTSRTLNLAHSFPHSLHRYANLEVINASGWSAILSPVSMLIPILKKASFSLSASAVSISSFDISSPARNLWQKGHSSKTNDDPEPVHRLGQISLPPRKQNDTNAHRLAP